MRAAAARLLRRAPVVELGRQGAQERVMVQGQGMPGPRPASKPAVTAARAAATRLPGEPVQARARPLTDVANATETRIESAVAVRQPRRSTEALAEERLCWVILACVEGVGERTITHLVATYGSARHVLERAREGRLDPRCVVRGERAWSLPRATVERITRAAGDPGALLRALAAARVWTITALDPDYPARLHDLVDPPAVLFGIGDPAALRAARAVALVGTRHPTPRGRVVASRIAAELAEADIVVVSGLALGVDGAAHAAVVERRRPTVAVIGAGHLEVGPRAHRPLARAILETGGAVVSELPPSARATRGSFPRRNRLISGLADAVVVGEAPARSGALITARLALEQGRSVFVVGGDAPDDWSSAGSAALLSESNARGFPGVAEMVRQLGWQIAGSRPAAAGDAEPGDAELGDVEPEKAAPGNAEKGCPAPTNVAAGSAASGNAAPGNAAPGSALSLPEARLVALLRGGPVTANDLVRLTGLPAGVAAAALTLLQLRGLVRLHGPLYLPAGALLTPFAAPERVARGQSRVAGCDAGARLPARPDVW